MPTLLKTPSILLPLMEGAGRGQIERIEAFGAKVSPSQDFVESIRWFAEDDLEQELLLDRNFQSR